MAAKRSVYYVNNKEMLAELKKYKIEQKVSEELGSMFLKIATRYASRPNFYSYSYKDDMISEAVLRMMRYAEKFNVDHPSANPFSYFTMVAHRQFLQTLKKEKKYAETKSSYRTKIWDDLCDEENLEHTKDVNDDDD
jgi:DNA-directed RNA polymerase specialized sigma24 family protein